MQSFSEYITEAMNNKEMVLHALAGAGYKDVRGVKGKVITVVVDGDRAQALKNIAQTLNGEYQAFRSAPGVSSSAGRTVLPGGWKIEAKAARGGGSGAGSDITAMAECAQCVYLAAAWYGGKNYDPTTFQKYHNHYDIDMRIDTVLSKITDDWVMSSVLIAEALHKIYGRKRFTFHRGSSWVNRLESHFKKLNQVEKEFSNLNKWTPADIYMVSAAGEKIDFTKTKSLMELNQLLIKAINDQDIIGVSLKKVGSSRAKIDFKNFDESRRTYKYKDFTYGKRGFFASNDIYISYDGGNIQFRTFGSTWQGEIKGEFANQGKISGGPIASIMKRVLGVDMLPQRSLAVKNEKNLELFYKWYSYMVTESGKAKTLDDFRAMVEEKNETFFTSMIMGSQFLYHFLKANDKQKEQIVSAILGYAASESEMSAPYVKAH